MNSVIVVVKCIITPEAKKIWLWDDILGEERKKEELIDVDVVGDWLYNLIVDKAARYGFGFCGMGHRLTMDDDGGDKRGAEKSLNSGAEFLKMSLIAKS